MRRVAVTGVGAVSALGIGVTALWDGVQRGQCAILPLSVVPTDRLTVRVAGQATAFQGTDHFERRQLHALDRTAQMALVAAHEAVEAAALQIVDARRAGVILGASIGHETLDAAYKTLYGDRSDRMAPLTVPRIMPSGPASHISIAFGLRGPSYAVASACASSTHAIGLAFQAVRTGQSDVMLTGGCDAPLAVGVLKAWEALRVLSPEPCRPFSRDRAGLTLGEGAGMLVLETWERAVARGATILGEIVGFGMSTDAVDLTAPNVDGVAWAIQAAIEDAGIGPEAIGYINAHGTGTRLNDRTEVAAIRRVFGMHADRLPISSTKSILGHTMCAGGALELIVTLLAMRDGVLPPTVGFREHDPECDIDCVPNASRPARFSAALSNSFAFGGLNAVLAVCGPG